ncbi:MAG TPA: hypothetical protein PKX52_01315 [Methanomassiliicoccaceae archaeon]|nr:hypothetical protein [Methanomassiliicoccaceae archaeon]
MTLRRTAPTVALRTAPWIVRCTVTCMNVAKWRKRADSRGLLA